MVVGRKARDGRTRRVTSRTRGDAGRTNGSGGISAPEITKPRHGLRVGRARARISTGPVLLNLREEVQFGAPYGVRFAQEPSSYHLLRLQGLLCIPW